MIGAGVVKVAKVMLAHRFSGSFSVPSAIASVVLCSLSFQLNFKCDSSRATYFNNISRPESSIIVVYLIFVLKVVLGSFAVRRMPVIFKQLRV